MIRTFWLVVFCFALSWLQWAHAQRPSVTVTFRWSAPTQYLDDSSIPASTVITYNLYAGAQGAAKAKIGSSGTATQYTVANAALESCYEVRAVISGQGESAKSSELCLKATIPKAVGDLQWVSITVQ